MSKSNNILIIRIPTELPAAILADRMLVKKRFVNRTIKLYDTFAIFKAITTTGKIQSFTKQRENLAYVCKISVSMLYSRVKELQRLNLIKIVNGNITLASWEDACKPFKISHKHKIAINYNIHDYKRVHHAFAAIEITQAQQKQFNAFHYHMDKNPSDKNYLANILFDSYKDQRVLTSKQVFTQQFDKLQRHCFENGKTIIEQFGTDIFNLVFVRRADCNRCVGTIRAAYKFKSSQSVSYLKKQLFRNGFITIDKDKPLAAENTVTMWGEDKWFDEIKRRAWVIPDRITVNDNLFSAAAEIQQKRLAA